MRKIKINISVISLLLVIIISAITIVSATTTLPGQTSYSKTEIYPGVTTTTYTLKSGYTYSQDGPQWLKVIEFNPKQEDLALDVVSAGDNLGATATVSSMVNKFNKENDEGKTVIAAVNGDLWTTEKHARVEGEDSDPVVKHSLCLPRGTTIIDGEIITSQNMENESPFDEEFQSFGIAADGTPLLGNLYVRLTLKNTTKGITVSPNGLNRLPANNTIVAYSDKGPVSNYCLDDAYEIVIDCDSDYTIKHGESITGTVTAISPQNSQRYSMKENRLIITARGSTISKLENFAVGDSITLNVRLSDTYGNSTKWQTVSDAVGGHIVVLKDGIDVNKGNYRSDPMTLIGYKADGTVVIIVNDGRQSWYSVGINRTLFDELGKELGIDTLFLLDGGGSTTLVELTSSGYKLTNRPSDYATIFTRGTERSVINAVLLSYVSDEPVQKYQVTWKNGDDVIYSDLLNSGLVPVFDSQNYNEPAKESDDIYTYSFIGWSTIDNSDVPSDIEAITKDTYLYAVYEKTEKLLYGDVNNDGRINAMDINHTIKLISGLIVSTQKETLTADVNFDGKVNSADIITIQKYCYGIINEFK